MGPVGLGGDGMGSTQALGLRSVTVLYSFFSAEEVVFAADSMLTTRGAKWQTTCVDAKDRKISLAVFKPAAR